MTRSPARSTSSDTAAADDRGAACPRRSSGERPRVGEIVDSVSDVSTGQTALDQLCAVVGELKRDDPLAPVTILAPSNIAAITARRALASRGGVAAIQVTTVNRLAEQLGAPALAPRRPATRAVSAAAWRTALAAG